jgi:hypothetical protein
VTVLAMADGNSTLLTINNVCDLAQFWT